MIEACHHMEARHHGDARPQNFSSVCSVVESLDWQAVERSLDADGFARLPALMAPDQCGELAALYTDDARFRSRIDMARFRFGVGEYKYFASPLPLIVRALREELYARLAPIANRWMAAGRHVGRPLQYPTTLDEFLKKCHAAGQTRPTPLLLTYSAGGYNCLHQDLYGDLAFPLQVVFALSRRDVDYSGGEFLLVEQRPRAQSRGTATTLPQGHGYIFTTRERPVRSTRGWSAAPVRHGVSAVRSGERYTLGLIFHDAE